MRSSRESKATRSIHTSPIIIVIVHIEITIVVVCVCCVRACVRALARSPSSICLYVSYLCIVPRAGDYKCFIESPRDSSPLLRLHYLVVGKESWRSRLHEHDVWQRGTRVPVSCTFSVILRSDDFARMRDDDVDTLPRSVVDPFIRGGFGSKTIGSEARSNSEQTEGVSFWFRLT